MGWFYKSIATAIAIACLGNYSSQTTPTISSPSVLRTDERSDLIARMKKTMASQDTQKEDPTDIRDILVSPRECGLLVKDLELNGEYAYYSGAVSVGPEKNGSDITVFVTVGTYVTPRTITLDKAREYLKKRERK